MSDDIAARVDGLIAALDEVLPYGHHTAWKEAKARHSLSLPAAPEAKGLKCGARIFRYAFGGPNACRVICDRFVLIGREWFPYESNDGGVFNTKSEALADLNNPATPPPPGHPTGKTELKDHPRCESGSRICTCDKHSIGDDEHAPWCGGPRPPSPPPPGQEQAKTDTLADTVSRALGTEPETLTERPGFGKAIPTQPVAKNGSWKCYCGAWNESTREICGGCRGPRPLTHAEADAITTVDMGKPASWGREVDDLYKEAPSHLKPEAGDDARFDEWLNSVAVDIPNSLVCNAAAISNGNHWMRKAWKAARSETAALKAENERMKAERETDKGWTQILEKTCDTLRAERDRLEREIKAATEKTRHQSDAIQSLNERIKTMCESRDKDVSRLHERLRAMKPKPRSKSKKRSRRGH